MKKNNDSCRKLFSIVIANYNYGRFLEDAIQSVLSQSCQDFELIIVDGGSTDNSLEIIRKHANGIPPNTCIANSQQTQSKVSWWVSEKDKGQSEAFNKGFAHARGCFLTWLNADDILMPGALESIAEQIKMHPQCEWFIGSSLWTNEHLQVLKCFCAHRFSMLRARWGEVSVGGPSSFFSKRLLDAVGGVDEGLHYTMDTDLWYRFYRMMGARYVRTRHVVFAYRQHEASKMSGADACLTKRSVENRRRAGKERKLLIVRYGRRYGIIRWLTFSPFDALTAMLRTWRYKGCLANEC